MNMGWAYLQHHGAWKLPPLEKLVPPPRALSLPPSTVHQQYLCSRDVESDGYLREMGNQRGRCYFSWFSSDHTALSLAPQVEPQRTEPIHHSKQEVSRHRFPSSSPDPENSLLFIGVGRGSRKSDGHPHVVTPAPGS